MEKVKVTVRTRDGEHTILVPPRTNLLQAIREAGVPFRWSCTRATCGKCQCRVVEGAANLQRPTVNEPARLSQTLVDMGFRLACQAKVVGPGDVVVEQQ